MPTLTFRILAISVILLLGSCKKEDPLGPSTESIVGIRLVYVAGGTLTLGSTTGSPDEQPIHTVTVGSFYMDVSEVTFEKWTEVRNWAVANGYSSAELPVGTNGYHGTTNHPVTEVNWYDVLKWCNARSEMDGLTPVYYTDTTQTTVCRSGQLDLVNGAVKWTANGYRLPTEAEWEFAARGGDHSHGYTYSGSNDINAVAWYGPNSGNSTHPVMGLAANELGLYDMSGNVWEWCWDWNGPYSPSAQTDPQGPTSGTARVLRGGSFALSSIGLDLSYCRVSFHGGYVPTGRIYDIGFRCTRK